MSGSRPLRLPARVRVPGSTSNLGPGFDFLGLALDLYVDASVVGESGRDAHELSALGGTAETWPAAGDNVFVRALDHALRGSGVQRALRIEVHSEIPIGRGFGSSGAATAAGLLLGAALADTRPEPAALVDQGAHVEGHPDNSTASLLGGCTLAIPAPPARSADLPHWRVLRQELHPSIGIALAWPDAPLPTPEARRALPSEVPFADAVENPRRVAALLEGLRSGDPELLALGAEDRLHVAYRLPLIPGAARALECAREAGAWLATISGSGSGLVALGPHASCEAIARAMARALEAAQGSATARVARPVAGAPEVLFP